MPLRRPSSAALLAASLAIAAPLPAPLAAQPSTPAPLDTTILSALRWREIGPFRGGRTKAAAGVPSQPGVFYVGVVNGGVWRTDDYGRTWAPIFDDQPTGSVGALAVAASDPRVVYVGSGEGLQRPDLSTGDGIYRSADGGATWTHLGLRDAQQIPQIVVDPKDPNRLFVAALGHPYGPNAERGVFRSTDGGRTFEKVLYRDENTGAVDLVMDPHDAGTLYAVLWEARQAPWENGAFSGPGSGVYKSTDGGTTWRPSGSGLPTFADGLGRIGITVAPTMPSRLFATVDSRDKAGLYRSDDAGATWHLVNADPRVTARESDFAEVKVDPTNADVVYTASVVSWKSTDGGKTFTAFKGAPGGDDYHRIWIDPTRPSVMLIAGDQGAVITVNGGRTWSSWYNQPTAQMYHVNTDNAFPYRVCGGQQESGSACVASRGAWGRITQRDWHTVGVEEYGYAVPDPKDPDMVYGGKLTRWNRRTGQVQNVAPQLFRSGDYRVLRTAPVLFSPADSTTLYFASNVVWRTTDGGVHWTAISPDLTRRDSVIPANVGKYAGEAGAARHPGVVYALAASPLARGVLWAGTDDGLIHLTLDGGRAWRDVTPPQLGPWAKVSIIDASPFDSLGAYAAVNTLRLDDLRPHVLRTRDGGRTWTEIVRGIPDGATVNVVRADPRRRGVLYAGTERAVYVSVDDGASWRSLRLNMPATSIRDLVIKDDDVVVGTHGRGFWILDDVSPLRQWDAARAGRDVTLFRPARATRVRWNQNTDTPLPPDEPWARNPPEGAVLDYWLPRDARRAVLEVRDAAGAVVRRIASDDAPEPLVPDRNIPDYWIRPARPLAATAGMHRYAWDLRGEPVAAVRWEYPIAAAPGETAREPRGPYVTPGRYTVRLAVTDAAGRTAVAEQPLEVRMDPRVTTPAAALAAQWTLSTRLADAMRRASTALGEIRTARAALAKGLTAGGAGADSLRTVDARYAAFEAPRGASIARVVDEVQTAYEAVQGADVAPSAAVVSAAEERLRALDALLGQWRAARGAAPGAR